MFMVNSPLMTGLVPDGWLDITDVMILKRLNINNVEKMRCIQLLDAEFNMINKRLGKKIIANAENLELIEEDQFGSRKKHKAINAVICKIVMNDMLRQQKRAGALGINDAKGCYDRINHTFCILVLMSYGLKWKQARVLMETLQLAQHRIKTGYGVSEPAYGSEDEEPLMGLGQGNGVASAGWTLISSKIISVMKEMGFGANLVSSITKTLSEIAAFAYVDDADTPSCAPNVNMTGEELSPSFQEALDCWSKLISCSGGELDPNKSCCYLIDFAWKGSKWEYRKIGDMLGDFYLLDKEHTHHPLKQREVSQATETLGVYVSMDGNSSAQKEALREKAKSFAEKLRTSQCKPNTAIYTYHTCFMKSMEYCMPATNFTKEEWKSIISPAKEIALQKAKMSSKFPSELLYGSSKYNAFFFEEPYTNQGIEKISHFLQETSDNLHTGEIMTMGAESFIQDLGFSVDIAEIPWARIKNYTSQAWFGYLIQFISECNEETRQHQHHCIEIKENLPKLPLSRVNDRYIMKEFVESNHIKDGDLRILNIMRMSIKAVTLSDICNPEGTKITSRSWHLQGSHETQKNQIWPRNPPKFTERQKKLWQDSIKAVFGNSYAREDRQLHLNFWLGSWTNTKILDEWECFYSV